MPIFEVEVGGKVYEVDAPDIETAAKQAQSFGVQQHPWNLFNKAAQSGQMPEPGKEYPGGGYVPTKTEAAGDVAMLGGMAAAGPLAGAAFPASPVLAGAAARTGVSAIPGLLNRDMEQTARGAGTNVALEGLMSILGLPGWARQTFAGGRPPAVHQALHYPPASPLTGITPPAVVHRTPGGGTPRVAGAPGGIQVTPSTITIPPPIAGTPMTGPNPSLIVQESLPAGPAKPTIGQGPRAAVDYAAAENQPLSSDLMMWLGLGSKLPQAIHQRITR